MTIGALRNALAMVALSLVVVATAAPAAQVHAEAHEAADPPGDPPDLPPTVVGHRRPNGRPDETAEHAPHDRSDRERHPDA